MPRTLLLVTLLSAVPRGVAVAQFAVGGIAVDPEGLIRTATPADRPADLPVPDRNARVTRPSKRRVVSLARLERAATGGKRDAAHEALAGLTRITEVHLLAADVLLVGPAEGWRADAVGNLVAATSGRPVLRFDDLVAGLRYAFTEESVVPFVGCSIDPTPEGMARHAGVSRALRRDRGRTDAAVVAERLRRAMGPQAVRVFGVPATTPLGLRFVSADVTLKLVAMGHVPSGVQGVPSYVALAANATGSRGSLRNRFWFVGRLGELRRSANGRSFELVDCGFALRASAPRRVAGGAAEEDAGPSSPAGRFVASFAKHREALVARHASLAALESHIGLLVACELIARPHLATADGDAERFWYPAGLIDAKAVAIPAIRAPRHVPSLAGVVRGRGGQRMVHVSGGVAVDPSALVDAADADESRSDTPVLPAGANVWWWDAAKTSR